MKKLVSMFLTIAMVLSICTLPAMAAPTFATIKTDYVPAEASACYENSFDDSAAVTEFGGGWKSYDTQGDTFGFDSDGKLKVTRGQYTTPQNVKTNYQKDITNLTTTESKICLISFKAKVDTHISYARYMISADSSGNSQVMLQIANSGQLRYQGGDSWKYPPAITAGTEHTYTFVMNYNDDTFSLWIDNGSTFAELTASNAVVTDHPMGNKSKDFSACLDVLSNDSTATDYGSMYLDDFKIIPLVEKTIVVPPASTNMPTSTGTLAYEENFDGDSTITDFVTAGIAQNDTDNLSLIDDGNGGKYLKVTNTSEPHYWHFDKATGYTSPTNNIVIQADIKTNYPFYANLGEGSNANCILLYSTKTVDNGAGISVTDIRDREDFTTITWMIGSDNSLSMWIGDNRDIHSLKSDSLSVTSKVAGDLSKINCINFRPQGDSDGMYVDNIRVFEAADTDFLKVDKVMRNIQSVTDCSPATDDGVISDLSADVVLEGIDTPTDYTVTFADKKGNWDADNNEMVFPLKATTDDIAVTVQKGDVTDSKIFEDVTIPAAYTFGEIDWGTDTPAACAVFDSAVIKATARNTASDADGRLLIVAALCAENGTEIKKVQVQNDTLKENGVSAEGFAVILNLENITELPANPKVKVFVWDKTTLAPLGEFTPRSY